MSAKPNPLNCLLCANAELKKSAELSGREIAALWREIGHVFPQEAFVGIGENSTIVLWRCAACGFEFFDPALAGNSRFYQCLESTAYYSSSRPEFHRTTQFAINHGLANVLDVGCGTGDFLDLARTAGLQTFGLELNPTAAGKARAKGHEIFDRLLPEVPEDARPGGFDLITLFQVLEHVPDPVGILKQAATCLKPGGYVSIAVPSKSGLYRFMPWDPGQWPPHHVSHWGLRDFRTLASQTNLRLMGSGGDLLIGAGMARQIHLHHRLAFALGKRRDNQPRAWPDILSWIYRKTGMKFIAPRWGSSIYAYFQKA